MLAKDSVPCDPSCMEKDLNWRGGAEMAKIVHRDLFGWNSVRGMPDLERFTMVLEALDDEEFVVELQRLRANGRNDYAVRPMWNSILSCP